MIVAVLSGHEASAHRPGETYVYLVVGDGTLAGEIHVRESDIAFLEEYGRSQEATGDYAGFDPADLQAMLTRRLTIGAGGQMHQVVPGEVGGFGKGGGEFATFAFSVPTLATVPDNIDIAFPFIFDGPNPRHRTLVLIESNAATGLADNESLPSLVFGPGTPPQSLALGLPPAGRSLAGFASFGVRQVLQSWPHLALVMALVALGVGAQSAAPVRQAAVMATLVALGLAAGAQATVATGGAVGPSHLLAAFGAASAAVLVLAVLRLPGPLRHAVTLGAAFALGSVASFYIERIGLEAGRPIPPAAGFFLGCLAATLALALLAVPARALAHGPAALALRALPILLAALALYGAWDTARYL